MTYASGGLIEATDYGTATNTGFIGCVNALWGTGSGSSGYGQPSTLSAVAASNTVTAVQWQNLIDRINSMRQHQSGVTSGLTRPNPGDTITFLSALQTQLTTITNNKLLAGGTTQTQSNVVGATSCVISNATAWQTQSIKEVSLTWPNADSMRYFFNAGGYISFTGVNSILSGNTKSTDWDALLGNGSTTGCGIIRIRANVSEKINGGATNSPSTFNGNLGFYNLTTSDQTILQQFSTTATGGYSSNNAVFAARLNALPGSATVLFLKMTLNDAAGDVVNDQVLGTVQMDYSQTPPSTAFLTANVWGIQSTNNSVTNTQT